MFKFQNRVARAVRHPKGPMRLIAGTAGLVLGASIVTIGALGAGNILGSQTFSLAGAAMFTAGLLLMFLGVTLVGSLRAAGALSLFISLLIFLNDTDHFYWGDLVDSVNNGVMHHEPFTLAFFLVGTAFVAASFFTPR